VDRYAPDSFGDVGTYQGKQHVLGIGIGANGNLANRGAPYQNSFYNTQGEGFGVSGGIGSVIQAQLYVPPSWSDAANGAARTDMWGVADDGTQLSAYAILGFTNEGTGGFTGFRGWDSNTGTWQDFAGPVNYGAWNTLAIVLTASAIDYFINGTEFYALTGTGSVAFDQVLMEAYNFADPGAWPGVNASPYTAYWANVPEPAGIAVMLAGLAGLAMLRRRTVQAGG
jgi:hypothetical protein